MKFFKVAVTIFIFSIFTLTNLPVASAGEIKIGYINLGKTLDEYKKTEESEKSLEEKLDKKEKERKKLVDEIRKLKDEMVLLSDKGKEEKQPVIDEKIKNLQEFDTELRGELQQERDEKLREIMSEIDKVIQDYGKKHGYTVILGDRMLVYGDESVEITREIIDILNKKYKKKD